MSATRAAVWVARVVAESAAWAVTERAAQLRDLLFHVHPAAWISAITSDGHYRMVFADWLVDESVWQVEPWVEAVAGVLRSDVALCLGDVCRLMTEGET